MIELSDINSTLYNGEVISAYIQCLKTAFANSVLQPDFWQQTDKSGKICGIIARHGTRAYIADNGIANIDEVKEFISLIGFSEIFCTSKLAKKLGETEYADFCVMHRRQSGTALPFTNDIRLLSLYDKLFCEKSAKMPTPEFEAFATDVSHRLRHNAAVAVCEPNGAALAFKSEKCAIINGITVKAEYRKNGIGSSMLQKLCTMLQGDIFLCCTHDNITFYQNNGFSLCDTAVILNNGGNYATLF